MRRFFAALPLLGSYTCYSQPLNISSSPPTHMLGYAIEEGSGSAQRWQKFLFFDSPGFAPGPATVVLNAVQMYGQVTLYTTVRYNGSSTTLPGLPCTAVCQWASVNAGSSATVVLSQVQDVGNEGGCGSLNWPLPLNITVGWASTTGFPGTLSLMGVILQSQLSFFPTVWISYLFTDKTPPAMIDAQSASALGASSSAIGPGLLNDVHRGSLDNRRYQGTLVVVSPQLGDGDMMVFVEPMIWITDNGNRIPLNKPRCLDRSLWPSPAEPACLNWTWAISVSAGGSALYIDGEFPCSPPVLTGGGPPPRFNPGDGELIKSCALYTATDHLWVLAVPLATPAAAALSVTGSSRAGSVQSFLQVCCSDMVGAAMLP
jgi:hypothetical protein